MFPATDCIFEFDEDPPTPDQRLRRAAIGYLLGSLTRHFEV
jgi:hypothetical protein